MLLFLLLPGSFSRDSCRRDPPAPSSHVAKSTFDKEPIRIFDPQEWGQKSQSLLVPQIETWPPHDMRELIKEFGEDLEHAEEYLDSPEPLVVTLTASFCPACRQQRIENERLTHVHVLDFDIEKYEELASELHVYRIPTIYIFPREKEGDQTPSFYRVEGKRTSEKLDMYLRGLKQPSQAGTRAKKRKGRRQKKKKERMRGEGIRQVNERVVKMEE